MKNLINISDLSKKDFLEILDYSKSINPLKDESLKNKYIGLIFEKHSTRTRLSFNVGIQQLKGHVVDINLNDLNLQRAESFEDTFEVMSCYLDALVFRTDTHKKLELASNFFKKPIINALSEISHPCQAISDMFTLRNHFNRDDGFKIVWLGDLNNVLYSLIEAIEFLDSSTINVFTCRSIYDENFKNFPKSNKVSYYFDIDDKVLHEADCVMTDVYNSMNDKEDKEELLKKFMVDQNLMKKTSDTTVFMHCLPAKIGSEVSNEVIKGPKSIVLKQAKNRMVAQRGIMKWLDL